MHVKKEKVAIVSRSFWPENPAIGEALLLLSESLSKDTKPIVITQVNRGFFKKLRKYKRGKDVSFATLPTLTHSSSPMILRISELLLFTGFTFTSLVYYRPDRVYIATNPPVLTPLAVRWYCELFNKKYIYHLQDIHPEITSFVTGKNNFITRLISRIDAKTTAHASTVITLTENMRSYINERAGKELPTILLQNPAVQGKNLATPKRIKGFIYCGNAGRLQRIPLLIESISQYIREGGELPFVFAGSGIYTESIQELAAQFKSVSYLGLLPADEASQLLRKYSFGLMPIEDEVTNYAFPSKSSSYIFSGCKVIAVCGKDTSVADWVLNNDLGYIAEPNSDFLANLFHDLEKKPLSDLIITDDLFKKLTPQSHANSLENIIMKGR